MFAKLRFRSVALALRAFQTLAIAEGGLLPAILLTALVHWITGRGATAVTIVGASHGAAFTAYILLIPIIARLLRWPLRTTGIAISVAFVPFLPWAFERRIRPEVADRIRLHRLPRMQTVSFVSNFD